MNENLTDIFTGIFNGNLWGGKLSRSGPGSEPEVVQKVGKAIQPLLAEYEIRSVFNIPCGDQPWHDFFKEQEYEGADIVPEIIEYNRKRYPWITFWTLDITRDDLPRFDMMFCRDIFGHLTQDNVILALKNLRRSKSRFLLTTTFPMHDENNQGRNGGWYPINIEKPPYSLKVIYMINEGCTEGRGKYADKSLALIDMYDPENIILKP